jgi:hypothetical protein
MLNILTVIPAANNYLPSLVDKWVQKELYGICNDGSPAPSLAYLIAYLSTLATLNCTTLTVSQQQCLLQFINPPQC